MSKKTTTEVGLGSSKLAVELGNDPVPASEERFIGRADDSSRSDNIDLRRQPVTDEAFQLLLKKHEGTHALVNFWPKHMQVRVAEALGRQITADEVHFFVGLDGEINSAVCYAKKKQKMARLEKKVEEIENDLEREIAKIDALDSSLYSDELKAQEKALLSAEAEARIAETKEMLDDDSDCVFTPTFWVDPWINDRLLNEMRENGGNVARAFLAGDRCDGIIRSGCFYDTEKGVVGLSGSTWFFDQDMKQVRVSTFPLGRMAVRHQEAGNDKQTVETYFGKGRKAREVRIRWHWGISNKEMERQKKVARERGEKPRHMGEKIDFRRTNCIIDDLLGLESVMPTVGRGVRIAS